MPTPTFLSPLALVGAEPVGTTVFPVSGPDSDPPWAALLAALNDTVGVERVTVEDNVTLEVERHTVDGQQVDVVGERHHRSVAVTHNTIIADAQAVATVFAAGRRHRRTPGATRPARPADHHPGAVGVGGDDETRQAAECRSTAPRSTTCTRDLVSLDVELDDQLAAMFRITVTLLPRPDGSWPYLDDDRFSLWRRVVVTAALDGDAVQLIAGYITHLRPEFGVGLERCRLDIWGMDATVLMDRADRLKDWPNKKDSDVAAEIFDSYGLTPRVTATEVIHDENVSTIIQRETDIQLLRRLALRNGFECFVDGDTGYFGAPQVDSPPQPVLAVLFGGATNVNRFSLEVNALTPSDVTMCQHDHATGDVLNATATQGNQPSLGAEAAEQLSACRDGTRTGPHRPHRDHGQRGDVRAVRRAVRPGHMVCDRAGRGGRQRIRPHPHTTAHGDHQRHRRGTQRCLLRHARDPSVHRSTATPKRFGSSETR